jgi:hypothetical protein
MAVMLIRRAPDPEGRTSDSRARLDRLPDPGFDGHRHGSEMIICRALQKLGRPRKKKSRHASERDTPEVRKKRREFREQIDSIGPRRLVFVDETGVTMAMTPAYGRAPRGERVETSAPASWESLTVIAAMGLAGVRAPLAFPGSVNAATFES